MAQQLETPSDEITKIFIVLPDRQTIELNVKARDKISNIKREIHKKTNIAVEKQSIMFEGKVMRHENLLKDYDIKNESELSLVVRDASYPALANMLKQHNLFEDLFEILTANCFDLEMLENDVNKDEVEKLCDSLKFDMAQRAKFRKLMRIIYNKRKLNVTYNISVALVGDMAVGKTCLIRRYVENTFNVCEMSSIGIARYWKEETLADNTLVKIDIYDTAGQERFQSICSRYYKKADVILVCYAVDAKKSLNTCEYWREQIKEYGKDDVFVILVGCKRDLLESDNKTNVREDAEAIIQRPNWKDFNAVYFGECSAKTGDNVTNVFLTAAELISENRKQNERQEEKKIQQDEYEEEKKHNNAEYIIPINNSQQENVDVEQALARKVEKKSGCFSSDSYVLTYPNFKQKQVDEVKIYDKILTFDELENKFVWDELLVKLHFEEDEYLNDVMVEMQELILDNGNKLVLTDNHLLYIENNGLCATEEVEIGDKLKQFDGQTVTVVGIKKNVMKKPRNLVTYNGNLVINGVAISTFTDTIWGENKCWGKALRYVAKHVNAYTIWRYPVYCIAMVWNAYLSANVKQAVMKFYLDD
eukprot:17250_1